MSTSADFFNSNLFYWHQELDAANNVTKAITDWHASWMVDGSVSEGNGRVESYPPTASRAGYTQFAFQMDSGLYEGCVSHGGIDEDRILEVACPSSIAGNILSKDSLVSAMDALAGGGYFIQVAPYDVVTLSGVFDGEATDMYDVVSLWNALFAWGHRGAWWCVPYLNNLEESFASSIEDALEYWIGRMVDTEDNLFYPEGYPTEWTGGVSGDSRYCNAYWLGEGVDCASETDPATCNQSYSTQEPHWEGDTNPRNCSWQAPDEDSPDERYHVWHCAHKTCDICEMHD